MIGKEKNKKFDNLDTGRRICIMIILKQITYSLSAYFGLVLLLTIKRANHHYPFSLCRSRFVADDLVYRG